MKKDFLAKSFSLPSLSTVEYSSGYLSFISYWTTIVVYNKQKSREITSLQERRNGPLRGHELTGNEKFVRRKGQ